jgi:hypothetical protein
MIGQDFTDVERQKILDEVSNNGRLLKKIKKYCFGSCDKAQSLQFASEELKRS